MCEGCGLKNCPGNYLKQGKADCRMLKTKKIALIVDSSMETEAIASSKGGEAIIYAREVLRGLGIAREGPTLLTTDNLANQRVGSGVGGSATKTTQP